MSNADPVETNPSASPISANNGRLARSASLISLGNIASRVLGQARESIIAYYFGSQGEVSVFRVAAMLPTLVYDFLIGGMLSAALVPVLSDFARQRDRRQLIRLFSVLLSLTTVVLSLLVLILLLAAPQVARLLLGGLEQSDPHLLDLATRLIRLVTPAILCFSLAGVVTAVLYSLQRFSIAALATAIYNLGIVLSAPLLARWLGIASLAIGILAGSLIQLLIMLWDVRQAGLPLRFSLDWRHSGLRRIVQLYLPIAAGLAISTLQVVLDRRLASATGEQSIAWMDNATRLQQLPLGLISVAISLAALPMLSQYFAAGDEVAYRQTLGRGLSMVVILIVPAAIGLWLLGTPIIRILLEHGKFMPQDTAAVTRALDVYVLGMVFAAIDFPLNYAFYARNNTLLPAAVGVASTLIYLIAAFALLQSLNFIGLVWADTAKQAGHALIMLFFTHRLIGNPLRGMKVWVILGAALAMAISMTLVSQVVIAMGTPYSGGELIDDLLRVGLAGSVGVLIYFGLLYWLGVEEITTLYQRIGRKI